VTKLVMYYSYVTSLLHNVLAHGVMADCGVLSSMQAIWQTSFNTSLIPLTVSRPSPFGLVRGGRKSTRDRYFSASVIGY
jgi:hypothetical protein